MKIKDFFSYDSENKGLTKLLQSFVIILFFFTIVLLILIVLDYYVLPKIVHSRPTVKIPDLAGKPLPEAEKILQQYRLIDHIQSEIYSEKMPAGIVVNQFPKPDIEVKIGRMVNLTVSKGKELVTVPPLIGNNLRNIRNILLKNGLQLGDVNSVFSDMFEQDIVISQSKPNGSKVPYGDTISVVISKGSERMVSVPSLVGLSKTEAEKILIENGLTIGSITGKHSDTFMPDTIIEQYPVAGEIVQYGQSINIVISK